jgi:excisionase family DNA binding protein
MSKYGAPDFSDRLLTAHEVAERLSVPETWVRAETRAGRMPHVALGRYRRYSWSEVEAWLEDQRGGQWRRHRPSIQPEKVR